MDNDFRASHEQVDVLKADAQSLIIEANAGVGKTTTLALRLQIALEQGLQTQQICVLTYTQPGVDALNKAIKQRCSAHSEAKSIRVQTFDAFCARVLREFEAAAVERRATPQELAETCWQALQQVVIRTPEKYREHLFPPNLGDNTALENFLAFCLHFKGSMKREQVEPDAAVTPDTCYEQWGCGYTDLRWLQAYELLRQRNDSNPDCPAFRGSGDATYDLACKIVRYELLDLDNAWPQGLRLVIVDEMHDMNQAMFTVLEHLLLLNSRATFCGVGDRHQVLHWRAGADARFMQTDALATRTGRTLKRLPLTLSHRFGADLAGMAGQHARIEYQGRSQKATSVKVVQYSEQNPCEPLIVQAAIQWRKATGKLHRPEFAVLLRHTHQSVMLENSLLQAEVPYVTQGFDSYLLRPEVLLIRGLFAVACGQPQAIESAQTRGKIIEAWTLFGHVTFGDAARPEVSQRDELQRSVRAAQDNPHVLTLFLKGHVLREGLGLDPDSVRDFARRRFQAAMAVLSGPDDANNPDALKDFIAALNVPALATQVLVERQHRESVRLHVQALQHFADGFDSAMAFFAELSSREKRLQTALEFGSDDVRGHQRERVSRRVLLASIDAVKGLEFDHVCLPYVTQGLFPEETNAISTTLQAQDESNLFYVAITRAKQSLTLYAHQTQPSRFVRAFVPASLEKSARMLSS